MLPPDGYTKLTRGKDMPIEVKTNVKVVVKKKYPVCLDSKF